MRVVSCKDYSRIWTCDNCTVAYKRWMCSALYRKCNTQIACPSNFTRTNDKAIPECVVKTCQVSLVCATATSVIIPALHFLALGLSQRPLVSNCYTCPVRAAP